MVKVVPTGVATAAPRWTKTISRARESRRLSVSAGRAAELAADLTNLRDVMSMKSFMPLR